MVHRGVYRRAVAHGVIVVPLGFTEGLNCLHPGIREIHGHHQVGGGSAIQPRRIDDRRTELRVKRIRGKIEGVHLRLQGANRLRPDNGGIQT